MSSKWLFPAPTRKGRIAPVTLHVEEFIRRFLQHVLPKGFVEVRTFGLWGSACRPRLEKARTILHAHHAHHAAIGKKPPRFSAPRPTALPSKTPALSIESPRSSNASAPTSPHISPGFVARSPRCCARLGFRFDGRAGVLDSTSSTRR